MLRKLSIKRRLSAIVVISALGLTALGAYALLEKRAELTAQYERRLETITALALSIVEARYAESQSGEITVQDAQSLAAQDVSELRYDGNNYLWINDLDGILVAHPHRAEQIGTSMLGLTDPNVTQLYREFVEAANNGGGFVGYVSRRPDSDTMTSPKLAHISHFEPWNWAIGTGFYIDDIDAIFFADVQRMAVIVVVFLVATGSVTILVARSILNGVSGTTETMRRLASGETDLTVPYQDQQNEIGQMAQAVEVFRVNAVEKTALQTKQKEAERHAAEERRAALMQMADRLEASVRSVVASIGDGCTELRSTSQSMGGLAVQTSRQASSVASGSQEASANVQTVASATEELTSSIGEISQQVMHSADIARRAVASAEQTNERVSALTGAADKIGQVVQLINAIAQQTNLLALNATIEAARAGEAGKGFAVVASEVKNLANQTAKATEEIAGQVGAMQGATGETAAAIGEIGDVIKQIDEIATTIAAAVEEQGSATREIARNVEQTARGAETVATNISGVSQASEQTGAAAGEVQTVAERLAEQSEKLRREIDSFLAQVRAG